MSENRRLYVGNIPFTMTNGERMNEAEVHALFAECGAITDVMLVRFPDTRRLLGYAFVEFATPEEAAIARHVYNDFEFHGRHITVDYAHPRQNGTPRKNDDANRGTADRRSA